METLTIRQARRLALTRAGLLKPEWTGMPKSARGRGPSARRACHEIVRRFGYLQLDSIGIAGARTQGLVLMSRLDGLDPSLAEDLLQPGEPLFEGLGHEACWQPLEDWRLFAFRRRELRGRPRWGVLVAEHRKLADEILGRIRNEGPLRSLDFESGRYGTNWQLKTATLVASALWGTGAPPSMIWAILGCSSIANMRRSAPKRDTRSSVSRPRRSTFNATRWSNCPSLRWAR